MSHPTHMKTKNKILGGMFYCAYLIILHITVNLSIALTMRVTNVRWPCNGRNWPVMTLNY